MNALKLASLVSATLTLLAPAALAQGDRPMPGPQDATVVGTEPGDVIVYEEHKTAGIVREPEAVRQEPGDVLSWKEHKTAGIGEEFEATRPEPGEVVITYEKHGTVGIGEGFEAARPYRSDVRYPLRLYLTLLDAGIQLHVDPIDEAPAWIAVCFDTEQGLVPVALLDARSASQTIFEMQLDEFRGLPMALFGVRFSADGFLEFSAVKTAAELADDADRAH